MKAAATLSINNGNPHENKLRKESEIPPSEEKRLSDSWKLLHVRLFVWPEADSFSVYTSSTNVCEPEIAENSFEVYWNEIHRWQHSCCKRLALDVTKGKIDGKRSLAYRQWRKNCLGWNDVRNRKNMRFYVRWELSSRIWKLWRKYVTLF